MRRLALLAVFGALVAGCGGEDTVQPLPETVEGTVPQAQPPTAAKGNPTAGKQVFTQSGCSGCHTFKPAGSTGTTGPDLDKLAQYAQTAGKPLDEFVHESIQSPDAYVEKGFPSGVMPAWSGNETQLNDLVAFLTQQG